MLLQACLNLAARAWSVSPCHHLDGNATNTIRHGPETIARWQRHLLDRLQSLGNLAGNVQPCSWRTERASFPSTLLVAGRCCSVQVGGSGMVRTTSCVS